MPKENQERRLAAQRPGVNSPGDPPPTAQIIWNSTTGYSRGMKHADPHLEYYSLAVKCERVFHTTANNIIDSSLQDTLKDNQIQWLNQEMEAAAMEALNQVRKAESLERKELTKGTFALGEEEFKLMCLKEERKQWEKKEKEMLIELLGEEYAARVWRKWKKEKSREEN